MKPLQEIYKIFVFLCICPSVQPMSHRMKLFFIFMAAFRPTILSISCIASFNFIVKYFSIDLANALCAGYQISGSINAIYSAITAYMKCNDFKEAFNAFQAFYDASE